MPRYHAPSSPPHRLDACESFRVLGRTLVQYFAGSRPSSIASTDGELRMGITSLRDELRLGLFVPVCII